jgi:predicted DsbA family dithiol-disulfide isomerase
MNIKILSACCGSGKSALEVLLKEMGVPGTIETITDMRKILAYGVMKTPALVINEKVKFLGRIPSKEEVKEAIEEELLYEQKSK